MIRVAFAIYRDWGYQIYKELLSYYKTNNEVVLDTVVFADSYPKPTDSSLPENISVYTVNPQDTQNLFQIFERHKIGIICFYSWSFLVQKPLLTAFTCLCLHPSKLPHYRGGTPIQHQIMRGETQSAVSIFKMSDGIDAGDIYQQLPISLTGDITDIFSEMVQKGTTITIDLINDALQRRLTFTPQKELEKFPPNKRRKPADSKIPLPGSRKLDYKYVYNLVRGLLDPYPNAYIEYPFGKILIQRVKKSTTPTGIVVTEKTSEGVLENKPVISLKLADGYALLEEYTFVKT